MTPVDDTIVVELHDATRALDDAHKTNDAKTIKAAIKRHAAAREAHDQRIKDMLAGKPVPVKKTIIQDPSSAEARKELRKAYADERAWYKRLTIEVDSSRKRKKQLRDALSKGDAK